MYVEHCELEYNVKECAEAKVFGAVHITCGVFCVCGSLASLPRTASLALVLGRSTDKFLLRLREDRSVRRFYLLLHSFGRLSPRNRVL